jgi:hypothetical protein
MGELIKQPIPLRTDVNLDIPLSGRKTIVTLLADDCRWPIGDPMERDFHFCGKRKVDGGPYCEFHMQQAFKAAPPPAAFFRSKA